MDTTPKPAPISRRESLKRAAGALALGLGAPAALASGAPSSSAAISKGKIEFYSFNEGKHCCGEMLHSMEVPSEIAEMLRGERSFGYLKIGDIRGESSTTFEVRRKR